MKKILIYLIIIALGSGSVYYFLTSYKNKDKEKIISRSNSKNNNQAVNNEENEEIIPSKDAFISEAIKLQTLAENKENNQTCKCYNVKELDRNTSLSGSILVYTLDDLFVSTMWLSNGYYFLNGLDNASTANLEESSEAASLYCGEENATTQSRLCATNY